MLNLVLPVLAIADVCLSFVLPRFMPQRRQAMIAAWAICESAAVMGLVPHLVTGWPNAWMLFALAFFGMLLHFPRGE